jgi:GT2 family glycosyltransferase
MRIAVGIATAGRREILSETLSVIAQSSRLPDRLLVCPAGPDDCDSNIQLPVEMEIVASERGLTTQRNAILDAARDVDVLVFFDDDFFPATDYLALLEAEIRARPGVAMITGTVLADDILGRGLTPAQARSILSEHAGKRELAGHMTEVYNGYGCNMAVSMSSVRSSGVRFDEALPLYGWLEDVDFSRALAPSGEILKSPALRGVHLGAKAGRTSGLRFGYSQIANPIYMWRKGTLTFPRAIRQIGKNILANIAKVLRPEPWVDRSGRLRGNAMAILDMFAGRMTPRRILELSPSPPASGKTAGSR